MADTQTLTGDKPTLIGLADAGVFLAVTVIAALLTAVLAVHGGTLRRTLRPRRHGTVGPVSCRAQRLGHRWTLRPSTARRRRYRLSL